jgi:hypothetical protein
LISAGILRRMKHRVDLEVKGSGIGETRMKGTYGRCGKARESVADGGKGIPMEHKMRADLESGWFLLDGPCGLAVAAWRLQTAHGNCDDLLVESHLLRKHWKGPMIVLTQRWRSWPRRV